MNRKKETSEEIPLVTYREVAPAPELRTYVRAYFSFTPGAPCVMGDRPVIREVRLASDQPFCSPLFADAHPSLVFDLGATCQMRKGWTVGTAIAARLIGPFRAVGSEAGDTRPEMLGV